MPNNYKIFMIAGENSSDLHASNLVRQLKSLEPRLVFYGLGGKQMAEAGVNLLQNIVSGLAIVGFFEVFRKLHKIRRVYQQTVRFLKTERPYAVILVDYPGFNLRIARVARALGIKVIYYISPAIWAWGARRIHNIARTVDLMLCILPFEEGIFREAGIDVAYVGHPLFDVMNLSMTRQQVFDHFQFDLNKKLVGLLPGSRKMEIERHLPVMVEAAEMIKEQLPEVQFVVPRASSISRDLITYYLSSTYLDIRVVDQFRYNVRNAMDFALVASGTAALETALLGCPMLIIYKTSFITWIVAKAMVKLPYIGLVNIIAGDRIVPELLQQEANPTRIADVVLSLLRDPEALETMKYQMSKVTEKLGGPGASERAASQIITTFFASSATP